MNRDPVQSNKWGQVQKDSTHPEILLHLEVVSRELARDVALHLHKDDDDVGVLFTGLIGALDQLQ